MRFWIRVYSHIEFNGQMRMSAVHQTRRNTWLNLEQKHDMKKVWHQDIDPNFFALNQQTSVTDAEVFG